MILSMSFFMLRCILSASCLRSWMFPLEASSIFVASTFQAPGEPIVATPENLPELMIDRVVRAVQEYNDQW